MPIPSNKEIQEIKTVEELISAYAKWGWVKDSIEYDRVDMVRGQVVLKRMLCRTEDLRCKYHGSSSMFIMLAPTGIIMHCYECRVTSGPISEKAQQVLSVRRISLREGWNLIDANNQQPPAGMLQRPQHKRRPIRELK